jgi:MOSC domain-containing protein YiiM
VDRRPRGRVDSINLSPGGVPKRPAPEATITVSGVEGDGHHDGRHHGGPDRAVTLFSADRILALQAEGHPIAPGTTGENVTVSGLDWTRVVPGTRLEIGDVRLEVTKYTTPCATIVGSLLGGEIVRITQKVHPGWSRVCARVLTPGRVRVGDAVLLLD